MIWEQIAANRRRSVVLITGMAAVLLVLGFIGAEAIQPGAGPFGLFAAAVIWLIQMGMYFGAAESLLLHGAFGREVTRDDNPRLHNIVEEMKLASGLPFMPRVYVVDDPAPNAFAIGGKPNNSVVAVTTGLLHRLNRDELQGVIAHEIGHLRNQDVKFMTLAAVMLGSIAMLSELVLRMLRFGGRGRDRDRSRGEGGGQLQIIIVLVAIVFAILGPLMAQLLYFACSRKREFLADACAAQYTRYPLGIAAALEKIAGTATKPAFVSKTTAPMCIINPLQAADSVAGLFSTHPPTRERVRILRNMGGASLADYESAFARVHHAGLIGATSLRAAPAVAIRQASEEGPIETRTETRATLYRQSGYLPLQCSCGLQLQVPQDYRGNQIRCIRCGNALNLPVAAAPGTTASPQETLRYQRRHTGWESFRCTCGRTLQISPAFSAPHIRCTNCRREIQVR
jgi:heat shock protein HtpX